MGLYSNGVAGMIGARSSSCCGSSAPDPIAHGAVEAMVFQEDISSRAGEQFRRPIERVPEALSTVVLVRSSNYGRKMAK